MLNVGALREGYVLDNIKSGKAMTIYHDLKLDKLDCTVAIIKNARSNKMGKKDIIKVEWPIEKLDLDIRITIPGHMQRGGSPCPYDRVLSTHMGSAAAGLILKDEYAYMVGIVNGKIKKVPLQECAGKLKMVSPDDQLVKAAKRIGISFGD